MRGGKNKNSNLASLQNTLQFTQPKFEIILSRHGYSTRKYL
jgi:hypothetical protein